MTIKVPAYTDINGRQEIVILEETPMGSFRKTPSRTFGPLEKHIEGLGVQVGQLIPCLYDLKEHEWSTPTVVDENGQEFSFYQYLRNTLQKKKLMIACMPVMHGSIRKFDIHEMVFTCNTSAGIRSRMLSKYAEAAELYSKDEEEAPESRRA